jgi:hypothetical protein
MNLEEYNNFESEYVAWKDKAVIADCFRDLDMNDLAIEVIETSVNVGIIDKYLSIIMKTVNKVKYEDVLDRLYFAGLIKG